MRRGALPSTDQEIVGDGLLYLGDVWFDESVAEAADVDHSGPCQACTEAAPEQADECNKR